MNRDSKVAVETISPNAPQAGGVAERYALALLGLADDLRPTDPGAIDRIATDIDGLAAICRSNADFRALIADPRRGAAEQQKAVTAILQSAGIGDEVRKLVGVLIANRRLAALPDVAAAFGAKLAQRRGQQVAYVTTAFPLTDTQRAQIAARLTESGISGVKLVEAQDPSILGGLIVRIGSRLFDNSLKSKLQRMQFAMKGAA
ncbi:ATP synthase F1 subunit delta [Roseococcus pinisoli]|uniref:ATP synthase subunit delta n=1 Tax=Roseococcus pinisoli TaxID=2835040 RepID=A0ABS5Q9M8_9PROT|nr:ATP synthase F1 subunit delta [Roseococcus pinisoli]MBS7810391.1 ATP synthase F1 subunit delta [Roseococcus pinisoli]